MATYSDTSAEAAQVQAEVQRQLGPRRRLELACSMSDAVRQLAIAGLRRQHPEYSDRDLQDRLLWDWYGIRRNRG